MNGGRGTPALCDTCGVWFVVVLNWNSRDDTLAALGSACRATGDPSLVICVDNGSSDGSVEAISEAFPEVRLIESGANLGFAGGNNLGIAEALRLGAEWVVLLNNDAVIDAGAIEAFRIAANAHPSAGVLAGKLFYDDPPEMIWFAGQRVLPRLGYSGRARGWRRRDGRRYRRGRKTGRAAGALMAISREAIEQAGMFDDRLFLYVEDVDLSLRAASAGFEVRLVPGAVAWHKVSASSGGEDESVAALYYGTRNTVHVCEGNAPMPEPFKSLRRAVIRSTFLAHAMTRPNRQEAVAAVNEGFRDAQAGRLGRREEAAA